MTTNRDAIIGVLNDYMPRTPGTLGAIEHHAIADDICEALYIDAHEPTR